MPITEKTTLQRIVSFTDWFVHNQSEGCRGNWCHNSIIVFNSLRMMTPRADLMPLLSRTPKM